MLLIPFDLDEIGESGVVIILEKDNLERMKKADPITLESAPRGFLNPIKYPNRFNILIAYEEDSGPLYQMAQEGKIPEMVKYIKRGYEFTDKDGYKFGKIFGKGD